MCATTVLQHDKTMATEKLAFELDKSFSGAAANLQQQNPSM